MEPRVEEASCVDPARAAGAGETRRPDAPDAPLGDADADTDATRTGLRRLAVLLLVNGRAALAALAAALRRAVLLALARLGDALAAPARLVARALLLSASPVRGALALLSQLASVRLLVAANDDRGGGAALSARLGAQVALLFGSVRCVFNNLAVAPRLSFVARSPGPGPARRAARGGASLRRAGGAAGSWCAPLDARLCKRRCVRPARNPPVRA
jgi:hypothetical protein